MPGPVFIDGDDVALRTIEAADKQFLQKTINHPALRQYAGGTVPYNRERFETERYEQIAAGDIVHLLVCDDDTRVGDVSLAPIDNRRGWANLGYRILPEEQGAGYATEAVRLIVEHGFTELRLHRISATIIARNEASKRVVEKLGFTHEGTKRDDAYIDGEYVDRELYAVLRDEWNAQ